MRKMDGRHISSESREEDKSNLFSQWGKPGGNATDFFWAIADVTIIDTFEISQSCQDSPRDEANNVPVQTDQIE